MIKDRITKCIKNVLGDNNIAIKEDVDIKVYGLDSLLKVQLVIMLEDEFGISFEDDDINQDNFKTLNTMAELLKKYNI